MEFIKNETSGKYTVTLGGVVWNNCTVDADCPGYATCSKRRYWQEDPATCICPLTRFVDGVNCDELNPIGVYEVIWYTILAVAAFIMALLAMHAIFHFYKGNKGKLNASLVSLVLATIGALTQTALCANLVADPLVRLEPNPVTGNRPSFNLGLYVCIPIVFLFSSLAAMNVSLVWVKIADNAARMKLNSSIDLINYRRALFVYYIVLMTLMCAALAMQSMAQVIIFAMIGIFVVGLTYTIAQYKVASLIKSFSSSSKRTNTGTDLAGQGSKPSSKPTSLVAKSSELDFVERPAAFGKSTGQSDDSKNQAKFTSPKLNEENKAGHGMKSALRDIRTLTFRMLVATYLYLVALVLFFTSGGASMYISPATNPVYARVTHGFIWFQNLAMLGLVIMYLHKLANRKRTASEKEPSSKSGDVAVSPESVFRNGTLISSKPGSKEDM